MASKPAPIIDVWNKPFWDACREHRLLLQKCTENGKTWYPPSPVSPYAPRGKWEWVEVAGKGKVLSWVVFHQKYFEGFADDLPYVVAMVELDEGSVMLSNVTIPREEMRVGLPVQVRFEDRGDHVVPVFGAEDATDGR